TGLRLRHFIRLISPLLSLPTSSSRPSLIPQIEDAFRSAMRHRGRRDATSQKEGSRADVRCPDRARPDWRARLWERLGKAPIIGRWLSGTDDWALIIVLPCRGLMRSSRKEDVLIQSRRGCRRHRPQKLSAGQMGKAWQNYEPVSFRSLAVDSVDVLRTP